MGDPDSTGRAASQNVAKSRVWRGVSDPPPPHAPLEDAPKFFELNVADPPMLKVCNVRHEQRAVLPAITHVDGTARLQTVHPDTNSRYCRRKMK